MECLKAAINAGCDAVYLSGINFGARSFAGNFSNEELEKSIKLFTAECQKFEKQEFKMLVRITRMC